VDVDLKIKAGYYYNSSSKVAVQCGVDQYHDSVRSLQDPAVDDCLPCDVGYSTNGALGSVACNAFVAAGYKGVDNKPAKCEADTFSSSPRPVASAAECDPCDAGYSTSDQDGATVCGTCYESCCYCR
jgi:hypothetical protein